MSPPTPVTVIASYSCAPGHQRKWLSIYDELAQVAAKRPACHEFVLLQSHTDSTRVAVLSRWDDTAAFHAFVRDVGLLWLQRMTPVSIIPSQITYLDAIPDEVIASARIANAERAPVPV